jgi:hypothetical protein
MSIHSHNGPFIRACYAPTPKDHRAKRHHAAPYRPELRWFFGGIIGTPVERKLAEMMNRKGTA